MSTHRKQGIYLCIRFPAFCAGGLYISGMHQWVSVGATGLHIGNMNGASKRFERERE